MTTAAPSVITSSVFTGEEESEKMSACVYVFQRVYCRYVSQTVLRVMHAQSVSKNMRLCGFAAALFMCLCVWVAFLSLWA